MSEHKIPSALEKRLCALPNKCSGVLRGLYSLKHIDEFTLDSILDAGDLAGDKSRLYAFATSFIFLRSQGVAISGVIQMSKEQGRKVNLWWSPKRWSEQFDRLSRYAALERLCKENVSYDTKHFDLLVGEGFPGYLIKNSKRLGMEGLRQRHCIASWHSKLVSGECAICVVFINNVRWAVELQKPLSTEHTVRIGQIKSRYNKIPNTDTRSKIYSLLGIEDSINASTCLSVDDISWVWRENISTLIPVFSNLGIDCIDVRFSGRGDNGHINDMTLPEAHRNFNVKILRYHRCYKDGRWVFVKDKVSTTLESAVSQLVYDYLEETGVDWYSQEGSRGRFTINVADSVVEASIDQYFMDLSTEHSASIPFEEII